MNNNKNSNNKYQCGTTRSDNLLPVENTSAIDINARVERRIPVEPDDGGARHRHGTADKPTDVQGQQSTLRVHLHYTASHDINVGVECRIQGAR